jgi:hypothetical protein
MVGSALGVWWWTAERRAMALRRRTAHERGTVIFSNTPTANTAPEPGDVTDR